MSINGSLCVVTGATEGIGRAIAGVLGKRGARLALCARTAERVQTTVDDLKSHGVDAWGAPCDVSDEAGVTDFAAQVAETRGHVRVLMNNAGIGHLGPFTELTTRQIDETLAVNVRGLMLMTKAFLPGMQQREDGQIVNTRGPGILPIIDAGGAEVEYPGDGSVPGIGDTLFFEKAGFESTSGNKVLQPEDVAETVVAALELPPRALVSELDIRPTNP